MKKHKEAPTTVVRQREDDDPIGRGNYLNITGKRMLIRILYLFKIGLLCINSRSNLAKKKFRNVHHKVAMVFGCAESTIQNVDHILFELYCYEVVEYLNKKFPIGKYPPAIFIIDGAKSHKKLLLSSITKNDNMAKMREYMRAHSEYAPCDTLWDEEAKGVGKGGKLSKDLFLRSLSVL